MYKKMTYEQAREIGPIIEEFMQTYLTYRAYVYAAFNCKERVKSDKVDTGFEAIMRFDLVEAIGEFLPSLENSVAIRLGVSKENLENYANHFGFKSLIEMTQEIGEFELDLVSDYEAMSLNKRVAGKYFDKEDLAENIESYKDVHVSMINILLYTEVDNAYLIIV